MPWCILPGSPRGTRATWLTNRGNQLAFEQQRPSTGLVDVLDRVLDKGLLVAGDIRISLAEVELLTIRIRLIVCSIDKAQEIGMDWWRHDPHFAGHRDRLSEENEDLRQQVRALEARMRSVPGARRARRAKTLKRATTPSRSRGE